MHGWAAVVVLCRLLLGQRHLRNDNVARLQAAAGKRQAILQRHNVAEVVNRKESGWVDVCGSMCECVCE